MINYLCQGSLKAQLSEEACAMWNRC